MLTPVRVLLVLLVGLSVGLASLWLDESGQPLQLAWQAPAAIEPAVPEVPQLAASSLTPREQLLARPLFTPDRKPLPPPPPPKPQEPPDPMASVRLMGVIGGDIGGVIAQVDGQVKRVMLSQKIGTWTLSAIDGRKVTFKRDEETRDLLLAYAPLGTRGPADEKVATPVARPNLSPGAGGSPDPMGVAQRTQEQLRARQAARAAARERAGLNTVAPQ